jgi:hypothetical protein
VCLKPPLRRAPILLSLFLREYRSFGLIQEKKKEQLKHIGISFIFLGKSKNNFP